MKKTMINGKEVLHNDVIFHKTTTKFKLWDRIKILIGREVTINSELYTTHEDAKIVGSRATTSVARLIPSYPKRGFEFTEMSKR